ncbi:uncharacterized protein A1O5_05656 [Cladophialophora psammophila CBS 110553]|uniref:Uncharacterized protein n=1 Tax=Cladophialophora psammophila CBS 110553 TaxID=1182543 RepID=W9X156_9EURO|nr:uncharacterized protein A1O5_05656 [Cladophialophora psammophila CBS 110553]EXJ70666.1 hypothetical protein A1O5_05656 [Cladophialophora psammophila CBS 110553]
MQTSSGLTFALQALLNRHESYVSESQQEHQRLTAYINELENERSALQTTNDKIVEENRQLLTQLETANTSLKESDSHVKSLEALLRDCEVEVRRLNGLSRRTEELELKILEMEKERMTITQQADDARGEIRSTVKRWKESEIRVRQLEREVQRIEWDAKEDRERYEEIIARLERERVLERELGGAEGRLKSAAAFRGPDAQEKTTNVVGHFVRDILQDNANLQAGVVELKELLQASNEEVQNLREQILEHQPVDDSGSGAMSGSVPLSDQLGWSQPAPNVQQSVHVHHHYHAKLAKRDRTPTVRRSSRKRTVLGLGMLPSTPESSAPTTPVAGPHRLFSSPVLPITLHQPQATRKRWSMQSAATSSSMMSSFPSSPRSYLEQSSSIFDRLEAGEESSRPTSPESTGGLASPPLKFNPGYEYDERTRLPLEEEEREVGGAEAFPKDEHEGLSDEADLQHGEEAKGSGSHDLTPKPSQIPVGGGRMSDTVQPDPPAPNITDLSQEASKTEPPNIIIEGEPVLSMPEESAEDVQEDRMSPSTTPYDLDDASDIANRSKLRRTSSHDSLVSISGMDIHIAKRPTSSSSQSSSVLRGNKAYFALGPSAARRIASAQPLATVTEYTALSSMTLLSSGSSNTLSSGHQLPQRSVSSSFAALSGLADLSPSHAEDQQPSPSGFGRLLGGWVRGKWGIAPMKSSGGLTSSAASIATSSSSETQLQGASPFPFMGGRLPGINQKGPIPGFKPAPKISGVQVTMVDEEGLKQTLAEG